jgi:hypothetical protein
MSRKVLGTLLTLLVTCLASFGLPWTEHAIQTPVYGSCFFPRTLVQALLRSPSHYFRDLHKIWCSFFVGSIAKSHRARYTSPNKKNVNISMSILLRELLYTYSQNTLVLSSTGSLRYCNCSTDAAPVPEVMNEPLVPGTNLIEVKMLLRCCKSMTRRVVIKFRQNWFKQDVKHYCFPFGIRKNCLIGGRCLLLYQFTKRALTLAVVIIVGYRWYQLQTKFYPTPFFQS